MSALRARRDACLRLDACRVPTVLAPIPHSSQHMHANEGGNGASRESSMGHHAVSSLERKAAQAREDALRAEAAELRAAASSREIALLADVAEAKSALATAVADAKRQGITLRGVPRWVARERGNDEASAAKKAAETIQRFVDSTVVAAAAAEKSRVEGLRAAAAEKAAAVEAARREGAAALATAEAAHTAALCRAEALRTDAVQQAKAEAAIQLAHAVEVVKREALASQTAALRKARVSGVAELVAELEAITRADTSHRDQPLSPYSKRQSGAMAEASSKCSPWQAPHIENSIAWKSCFFKAGR